MKYTNFTDWAMDVKDFFPNEELNTNAVEYTVSDVAYWDRIAKVGYISIADVN
jgi:hypothetical protein